MPGRTKKLNFVIFAILAMQLIAQDDFAGTVYAPPARRTVINVVFPDSIKIAVVIPFNYRDFTSASIAVNEGFRRFDKLKTDTFEVQNGVLRYEADLFNPVQFLIIGSSGIEYGDGGIRELKNPKNGPGMILIEPGDSIKIDLLGAYLNKRKWVQSVNYTGIGAGRLECQKAITANTPLSYGKTSFERIDSTVRIIEKTIDQYKPELSKAARSLLLADNFIRYCSDVTILMRTIFKESGYSRVRTNSNITYQQLNRLTERIISLNNADLAYSGEVRSFLIGLLKLKYAVAHEVPYEEVQSGLKKEHIIFFEKILSNSPLKSQVIGLYVASAFSLSNEEETLNWSVARVKSYKSDNPALIKTLEYLVEKRRQNSLKGNTAYDFNLPDTLGNKVSLNDYKGKVVLLDFMFTGCINCIKMVPILKKVEDGISDKTAFVSIAISTDKKNVWRNGGADFPPANVPGSLYLYTNNQGYQHEVISKYNVAGMPTLVLIDKDGKIIANPAPDPRYDGGIALKKLIEENIN